MDQELILHKLIYWEFINTAKNDEGFQKLQFTFETPIIEIEKSLNRKDKLKTKILQTLENVPDKVFYLESAINNLEKEYEDFVLTYIDYPDGWHNEEVDKVAYLLVKYGFNAALKHFSFQLSKNIDEDFNSFGFDLFIYDIAKGVAIAYLIPELKIELKKLKDGLDLKSTPISNITTNTALHKLQWKGTPAQFAFIINLLQQKGYIEGLTPFGERNAKILLSLFEIDGHNTTPESLGKCFQQLKKDELPINKEDASRFLKIPHRNDLKS